MDTSSWRRKVDFISFKKWPLWKKTLAISLAIFFTLVLAVPISNPLFKEPLSTTLRASDGQLLSASIAADEQWRFPPADSIPDKFATAIRLYEDEYFYFHPGINPGSLLRALRQNIRAGKVISGGSTLTMQTVRMAYHNRPRTYFQKLIEVFAAFKIELFYSKAEILGIYANNAPYGGNIVGLSAASWRYYGRASHLLSWAETTALAVLPNNPADIFPGKNEDRFRGKRNRLLNKLFNKGYLTEDELFLAKEEPLPQKIITLPNLAYHLLHRSITDGHGGTNVISTLNLPLQRKVKNKLNNYSAKWAGNQVHNAAALVVDIKTGEALAYVGNSESTGAHGQYVDIIPSRRSPGSLLKPILYAAALDEGLIMPTQLLPDIPLFYRGFAPQNFDRKYRGAVPANQALISSLNVPFVHLLIDYGYEKFHQKLRKLGFKTIDQPASHYGLSLILGGAETSLWELTSAYAGMARAYHNYPNRPYKSGYSASDYFPNRYLKSSTLADEQLEETGYLQASSVGLTFETMQQLNRPDQEAGWESFDTATPIAWKTGTSFGLRDGWAVGISDNYVVGVWLGNADGEGRPGLTGVQAAAPLLFQLFSLLPNNASFNTRYGTTVEVCRQSGMRAGKHCTDIKNVSLPEYFENTQTCTYHRPIHLNADETLQVNSNCYDVSKMKTVPWFILPPVISWYYQKHHPEYQKLPPFAPDCVAPGSSKLFELIYPRQFTKVFIPIEQDGQPGQVIFEAAHENKKALLYWHLDDKFLGTTEGIHQLGIRAEPGIHILTLVDSEGNELVQKFKIIN
jgi:penicillin-binding protein 1C